MSPTSKPAVVFRIEKFLKAVTDEVNKNPAFAASIGSALGIEDDGKAPSKPRRRSRRNPAILDPFALYQEGQSALQSALDDLDVERLKDIVAEYGMDHSRLAMRWKAAPRLVDLIIETVKARTHKGEAFRAASQSKSPSPEAERRPVMDIYYTNSHGSGPAARSAALDKLAELARNSPSGQAILALPYKRNLDNYEGLLSSRQIREFKKAGRTTLRGVSVVLHTEHGRGALPADGPVLALDSNPSLLASVIGDPRATAIVYVPWSKKEMDDFIVQNPDAKRIF